MEYKGYKYTEAADADIVLSIHADSEYKSTYVPPSTISLPKYEPGRTINTYGNFGSDSFYATTRTPGKWTSENITIGGYTTGNYYPAVSIAVWDGRTNKPIWTGFAVGTSNVSDVRVSSQDVIYFILNKFPDCKSRKSFAESGGMTGLGFSFRIITLDGNHYYPVVVERDKYAQEAGILHNDIILSVNGVSVVNKPLSVVLNLMHVEPNGTVNLEIFSLGRKQSVDLHRVN
jgi:hypothetical protein